MISGTSADEHTQLSDYFTSTFTNVTEVRVGDFANFSAAATQEALLGTGAFAGMGAADFVVIGRTLSSTAYGGGAAQGYNSLAIPVISFTSYTARADGDRLGWHTGSASNDKSTVGEETLITAAGEQLFGAGTRNWHESAGDTFNGTGTPGDVGGGQILATLSGDILVASWDAGAAPGDLAVAGVATFAGQRLLFNLDNDPLAGEPITAFNSLTAEGQAALTSSLGTVGFVAVPEPSSLTALLLCGLPLASRRRR